MTTSRPAAATHTRATANQAMYPQGIFYARCPFYRNRPYFRARGPLQNADPEARLDVSFINTQQNRRDTHD